MMCIYVELLSFLVALISEMCSTIAALQQLATILGSSLDDSELCF